VLSCSAMSEITDIAEQRDRGGRFVNGGKPGPGRPVGSRSRLGEQFLLDLKTAWAECGEDALRRCADEDPAAFCKIVASLLPKTIDLNVAVDVNSFATKFRTACALLGNPEPLRPRRSLPNQPLVIEHNDVS
jgi:hypothetical protein